MVILLLVLFTSVDIVVNKSIASNWIRFKSQLSKRYGPVVSLVVKFVNNADIFLCKLHLPEILCRYVIISLVEIWLRILKILNLKSPLIDHLNRIMAFDEHTDRQRKQMIQSIKISISTILLKILLSSWLFTEMCYHPFAPLRYYIYHFLQILTVS